MIGERTIQSRGLLIDQRFTVKVYPFVGNFERLYGTTGNALVDLFELMKRMPMIKYSSATGRQFLYGIALLWGTMDGNKSERVIDFFGFDYDKPWQECNPEYEPKIFRNGIYVPEVHGCETGLIVLGAEGNLRRSIVEQGGSLDNYLHQWPDIGALGPVDPTIAHFVAIN